MNSNERMNMLGVFGQRFINISALRQDFRPIINIDIGDRVTCSFVSMQLSVEEATNMVNVLQEHIAVASFKPDGEPQ